MSNASSVRRTQQQQQQQRRGGRVRTTSNNEEAGADVGDGDEGTGDTGVVDRRPTETPVIGVPRKLLDDFSKQYQILVFEASSVEQMAKDIRRIVDANFAVYKLLSSFLEAVRAYASRDTSSPAAKGVATNVVVSIHDLDALENERELRLLRSIVASNAETVGLGNSFLASIDPANLKRGIVDALNNVAAASSSSSQKDGKGEEGDESQEEKNPATVNLDDSGGLYSIRPTDDAISLDRLIGYKDEAREIVSFCRRVEFVQNAGAEKDSASRNPVVVILYGPPGTGKTTIAQSVAKYLDCVFMYVNAENVTSQWAGGTEKNIAKLFRRARIASVKLSVDKNSPRTVLLLLDEIDGLVKNRATSTNLTGEEYNRITTFLQMLTPPIGVDNSNIICVFTTNRLENVDAAIVNRARGKIFMGYVTRPADRLTLVAQVFRDFVNGDIERDDGVRMAAVRDDDLVPRDLQNILATAKNRILNRYTDRTRTDARRDVVINLSDSANRISTEELSALLNEATPGTNAQDLFRDYSPPMAHVCRWLLENRAFLNVARSAAVYRAHGKDC